VGDHRAKETRPVGEPAVGILVHSRIRRNVTQGDGALTLPGLLQDAVPSERDRESQEGSHEVPGDVSHEYLQHQEAEEMRERRNPRTGEVDIVWVQMKKRNDLFVLECYIAMLMEMAGLIGAEAEAVETITTK